MNVLFMILCAIVVIGFVVVIHEGGHYLAARAFGVRVTEFMIGLPGPHIGFTKGGTTFGLTAVPLGGYAKVCGMETGKINPYASAALMSVFERGTAIMEDVASDCDCTDDEAYEALEELVEWGSIDGPLRSDEHNTYRTRCIKPTSSQIKEAKRLHMPIPLTYEAGTPRVVDNKDTFFQREYSQQYRSLPFWKRSVILLAGIGMNLIFAVLAFILIYSVIGVDVMNTATGEVTHIVATPLQAAQAGFSCIGATFQAILGLFNPETAAETVSNSTSIVGIAVMSADFFAAGFAEALFFMAIVSVSIGLMNLLPIPPLDGGRFLIEIVQKITRRDIPTRIVGYISIVGMALFICFFIFMLNQDIQRYVFGNW